MTGKRSNALSLSIASEWLNQMLVDGYLDRITAHSIETTLRFLSDRIQNGARMSVDVVLTCDAEAADMGEPATEALVEQFFVRRALFLGRVHGMIGKSVSNVQLNSDGALTIQIGSSWVLLRLTNDDYSEDDWVWKVETEVSTDFPDPGTKAVCCFPEGGVAFFALRDS